MAYLAYNPFPQYTDDNGDPLSGGRIAWYISSTDTLKTVYQDGGRTTPADNPAILESDGRTQTPIYYGQGTYKVVLEASDGAGGFVPYKTIDPVYGDMSVVPGAASDISVETISELRLLAAGDYSLVNVGGYREGGDGGGGQFWYSPTSSLIDDGGLVISPAGGPAQGRYLRLLERPVVNPQMFGATIGYTGVETSFFNEMITSANLFGYAVEITPKEYSIQGNITFPTTMGITWFKGAKLVDSTDSGYFLSMNGTDLNILTKDALTENMNVTLDSDITVIPEWYAGADDDKYQLAWQHAAVLIDRNVTLTPGFNGANSYGSISAAPQLIVTNDAVIESRTNPLNVQYAYIGDARIDYSDSFTFYTASPADGSSASFIFVGEGRKVNASWFQIPDVVYLTALGSILNNSGRISFNWDIDFTFDADYIESSSTGMEHVLATQGNWDCAGFTIYIENIAIIGDVKHFSNIGQILWNQGPSLIKPEWVGAYANSLVDQKSSLTKAAALSRGTGLPMTGGPFYIDAADTYWDVTDDLSVVNFSLSNIQSGRGDVLKISGGTFNADNLRLDNKSRISANGTDTKLNIRGSYLRAGAVFAQEGYSVIDGCVIGDEVGRSLRDTILEGDIKNLSLTNNTFYTRVEFRACVPTNTYINNNTFIAGDDGDEEIPFVLFYNITGAIDSVTVNDNKFLGNGVMASSDTIFRTGIDSTIGHNITAKGNIAVGNYVLKETTVKFQIQIDAINDITLDGSNYELDKEINLTNYTCPYRYGNNPVYANMQLGRSFTLESGITGDGYLQDPQVYVEDIATSQDPLVLPIYNVNLWGDWNGARITNAGGYHIYQTITVEIDWACANTPQTLPWV